MSLDPAKLSGPYACCFDVGAFRADFAKACVAAWPGCLVECFEPLEPQPSLPYNVTWHPVALGPEHQIQTIWQCEFVPSSSMLVMAELHKDAFPYTRESTCTGVVVDRLDDYASRIRRPALLKLDTQGYELEVLRGAGEALDWFSAVVSEVSWAELYEGAPSFDDLDGFLTAAGFRWAWRVDVMLHPKTRAVLQSDELWLR